MKFGKGLLLDLKQTYGSFNTWGSFVTVGYSGKKYALRVRGYRNSSSRLDEAFFKWQDFLQEIDNRWPWQDLLISPSEIRKKFSTCPQVLFDDLVLGEAAQGMELFEQEYGTFEQLFWEPTKRERPARALVDELRQRKKSFLPL